MVKNGPQTYLLLLEGGGEEGDFTSNREYAGVEQSIFVPSAASGTLDNRVEIRTGPFF